MGGRHWGSTALGALVVAALLVQCSPGAQAVLEFDRDAIRDGQWWRVATGNFVHYDWTHLAANLGTFAALAWVAACRFRGALVVVALSAATVGAGVYLGAGDIATYRGVSGVDCALLAWLLLTLARHERGRHAAAWIALLAVVAAKFTLEAVTGGPLLPTSAPAGVAVVSVTHLTGLATGALAGILLPASPASRARQGT